MKCRHCSTLLHSNLIDLGAQPPSNSYLDYEDLENAETYFPLRVKVCHECYLVQTEDFTVRETFFNNHYAYFSSISSSWLEHARVYSTEIIKKFKLDQNSFVVEVASNDGYLLKNFFEKKIPCLGVEPSKSTADVAAGLGIETIQNFFGSSLATKILKSHKKADLIVCNNVLAHVPDINDFTKGLSLLASNDGIITIEFPHLLNLIKLGQFDTIYHEHYSYLSIGTVETILKKVGLRIFDLEMLKTHGGSVRVFACKDSAKYITNEIVKFQIQKEKDSGLFDILAFKDFQHKAEQIKNNFIKFLLDVKAEGKKVCGYGAAAKGNTLLNFSGIKTDLLPFVSDASNSKIGKFLPGSRIPILEPAAITRFNPDFLVIFPWNIADEIKEQFQTLKKSGCKFICFVPKLREI